MTNGRLGSQQSNLGNFALGVAGGATLIGTGANTLAFSQTAVGQSTFNRSALHTLTPAQSVANQRIRSRSAADTLVLADASSSSVVHNRVAQSSLALTDQALFSHSDYAHAASDVLTLTDQVDLEGTFHLKHCNYFNDWPVHDRGPILMKVISVNDDTFHELGHLCKLGEVIVFVNHSKQPHIITGPFDQFTLPVGGRKELVLLKAGVFAFASDKLPAKGQLNIQT